MSDLDCYFDAIRSGDSNAFGHWVTEAESRLRLSLRTFAADVDVEAVVQETMLRVWQVAPRFEPDGSPNALLRLAIRTARNLAISEVRRRKPSAIDPSMLESSTRLEDISVPEVEVDPMLRSAIVRCHDRLPAKPRSVLAARIEAGGSTADRELASGLGMTLNTFLQNFTRARRLLAQCLEKLGIQLVTEVA